MLKYFIENAKGEWMTRPGEYVGAWTRDPYKAWSFPRDVDEVPGRISVMVVNQIEGTDTWRNRHAVAAWNFFRKEGCLLDPGIKIVEQEFYKPLESVEEYNEMIDKLSKMPRMEWRLH